MKRFFTKTLVTAMMIATVPTACSHSGNAEMHTCRHTMSNGHEKAKSASRKELVAEIDRFIVKSYPKSRLCGERIVAVHDKYPEVEVVFILAQGIEESQLGTMGLGKKYNSVFNVGAFDGQGGKYMTRYSDPNDSIEPYVRLVSRRYLTDGRTTADLMRNYVDCHGRRYASNLRYERDIRAIYERISSTTEIGTLNKKYRSL